MNTQETYKLGLSSDPGYLPLDPQQKSLQKPVLRRGKKPVNIMRGSGRFPFLSTFSSTESGFGHSRGK